MSIGLADARVLRNDGSECDVYERGMLCVDAPTNHIGYVNEEFNIEKNIIAKDGVKMLSTGTPSYRDEFGTFRMLDRPGNDIIIKNGEVIPPYIINDLIQLDTKNIMDSFIVKAYDVDGNEILVCHVEKQPDSTKTIEQLATDIRLRLDGKIDSSVLDNMYLRVRTFAGGFPVAGSGKTDLIVLANEKIDNNYLKLTESKGRTRILKNIYKCV